MNILVNVKNWLVDKIVIHKIELFASKYNSIDTISYYSKDGEYRLSDHWGAQYVDTDLPVNALYCYKLYLCKRTPGDTWIYTGISLDIPIKIKARRIGKINKQVKDPLDHAEKYLYMLKKKQAKRNYEIACFIHNNFLDILENEYRGYIGNCVGHPKSPLYRLMVPDNIFILLPDDFQIHIKKNNPNNFR